MDTSIATNTPPSIEAPKKKRRINIKMLIIIPIWVYISFELAQLITGLLYRIVNLFGAHLDLVNTDLMNTIVAAFVYAFCLLLVIGVPWLVLKNRTSLEQIGMTRLPSWMDMLLAPAGLIVYFVLSGVLLVIAPHIIPGFNATQVQNTGFTHLTTRSEYYLAFFTLVVIAPLAEETLFRGYLLNKLRQFVPVWVAVLVTSALFGFLHGQWNLGVDTFALSIVLCLLRISTGNIWASVLVHMLKNAIAYYLLFINPSISPTLGK